MPLGSGARHVPPVSIEAEVALRFARTKIRPGSSNMYTFVLTLTCGALLNIVVTSLHLYHHFSQENGTLQVCKEQH